MSRDIHGRRHLTMQLGRALIGAIIGAAVGIGVLVAVYLLFGLDKVWLSIVVALLTGMGVRMMVSTWGHASYLRGAMTGVLALVAYLFGWSVVAQVAQYNARASSLDRPKQVAAAEQPADAGEDAATPAETPPPEKAPDMARRPSGGAPQKATVRRDFSTMDFLWLCIAGLVAYELGRGTAAKPGVVVGEETTPEVPAGSHPDA
jgi:hypothetical protein